MQQQTLSVVICAHNEERYIRQQLEAILGQERQPQEILVVDDASTDSTPAILDDYAARVPYFRVIHLEKNLGAHGAFNFGLEQAREMYIYAAAANDVVLPGAFKTAMDMLDRHPGAALFSGEIVHFTSDLQGQWMRLHFADGPAFVTPDQLWPMLGPTRWLPGGATFGRRDILLQLGGFAHDLGWMADQWLWLVIGLRHGFCYAPNAIAAMRVHEGRVSDGINDPELNRNVWRALLDRIDSDAFADIRPRLLASDFLTTAGSIALIRELYARWDEARGRPHPGVVENVGTHVLGLPDQAHNLKRHAVATLASELLRHPRLGREFAQTFGADDDVTLVVLAPDGDPGRVAAELSAAIPEFERDNGPDVMIWAVPEANQQTLADRCTAVLTSGPVPDALRMLPVVKESQVQELRQRLIA